MIGKCLRGNHVPLPIKYLSHPCCLNTRYAARKSLLRDFRLHLHDFESRGKGCTPCSSSSSKALATTHTRGIEINDMMKTKFSRSRRHSLLAWLTFMCLLLLAFIYAENTDFEGDWFRTPHKYNVTALLEADDDTPVDSGKPSTAVGVKDDVVKKGKTNKKVVGDDSTMPLEDDEPQKTAKTTKVSKEEKAQAEPEE